MAAGAWCLHISVFLFLSFHKFRCRRLRPYYPRPVLALFLYFGLRLRVFRFLFFVLVRATLCLAPVLSTFHSPQSRRRQSSKNTPGQV
uniref:Uncharacterized protein n=1 Tax=Ixodes ricinus TaxID=34613 RepID=A0A6B0TZW7_IXORI